jgi:hypothetical protein
MFAGVGMQKRHWVFVNARDFRTFGHLVAAWLLRYNFGQSMLVLRRTCIPNRRDGARGVGGGARERAAAAVAASFRCDSGTQVP